MLPVKGLYGHIRNNNLKSAVLLAGFVGLIALFWFAWCLIYTAVIDGWLLAPAQGKSGHEIDLAVIFAKSTVRALEKWYVPLFFSACWFVVAYAVHADLILAATGSRAVTRKQAPRLYNLVENLAISCGMTTPRIEIMPTPALNAYAAGLGADDAVVAVTTGLLAALDDDELQAVLAHEMAHIRNRDVRLMVVATVFAGGLTLLGDGVARLFQSPGSGDGTSVSSSGSGSGSDSDSESIDLGKGPMAAVAAAVAIGVLFLALTHLFALLTRLAISRTREFMADAGAVELTKNPDALIRALRKISQNDEMPDINANVRAMMISSSLEGLFSTHPPIEERVAALVAYAGGRDTFVVAEGERELEPADAASPWGHRGETPVPAAGAMPAFGKRRSFLGGVRLPRPIRS